MDRDEAIRLLRQHRDEMKGFGVMSISVFGSTARGNAGAQSDVDVLVEFEQPPGLREFMGLKFALEGWLGRAVDLIDRAAVRDRWRIEIERDAILVA